MKKLLYKIFNHFGYELKRKSLDNNKLLWKQINDEKFKKDFATANSKKAGWSFLQNYPELFT